MEVADQDDILFADLSKQISLLIMDDEDHLPYPPVTYQVYSRVVQPMTQPAQVLNYEQSKGTGVFIPRSTHRRRKSKQGRSNTDYNAAAASKNTTECSQNNSKGLLAPQQGQLAYNNYTFYSSFNHKRI
ncbi:uncharacterized protein LOC108197815 [Daucus carota subsp. sativus]